MTDFILGIGGNTCGLKANLHLIHTCNAHCRGCFAAEFPAEARFMPFADVQRLVSALGMQGVTAFNLAGGEPTLHPQVHEILRYIAECGFKASIITNGSRLDPEFLARSGRYLETVGISVDSFERDTCLRMGRYTGSLSNPHFFGYYEIRSLLPEIRRHGIGLKVNTVVSRLNFQERMSDLIADLGVDRWKIIRMKPYSDGRQDNFSLLSDDDMYAAFVKHNSYRHRVIETDLVNSYLVIDPEGNLLDNRGDGSRPYAVVGNLLRENAALVLGRFAGIFNADAYRERYQLQGAA